MSSLHGKISTDEEVLDLGKDGFEVPEGFQPWILSPGCTSSPFVTKSTCQEMRCFFSSEQKEKLGKPDA